MSLCLDWQFSFIKSSSVLLLQDCRNLKEVINIDYEIFKHLSMQELVGLRISSLEFLHKTHLSIKEKLIIIIQQRVQIWILIEQKQGIWKNRWNYNQVRHCCKAAVPNRRGAIGLLLADVALGQRGLRSRVKRTEGNLSLSCILIITSFNNYQLEQLLPLSGQAESTCSDPNCSFPAAISLNIVIISFTLSLI